MCILFGFNFNGMILRLKLFYTMNNSYFISELNILRIKKNYNTSKHL